MTHEDLIKIVKDLPEDTRNETDEWFPDCSCGCKFFAELRGQLGADWGVCCNPESHRVGLLTFEHQGCKKFVLDENL